MSVARISIGMPVYNGSLFIREAIDSLLAQTYTNFELIISDNCSTDSTEAICRKYAARDKRIRYIRHVQNRGALANFAFVLDQAEGEFFMWAAADDRWQADWIATLLHISEQFECLAFGWVNQINEHGKPISHRAVRRKFTYRGGPLRRRLSYALDPPEFGKANTIYGLARREVFSAEALLKASRAGLAADMVFVHHLLKSVEIISCPETFIEKRIASSSINHPECTTARSLRKAKMLSRLNYPKIRINTLIPRPLRHIYIYFGGISILEGLVYLLSTLLNIILWPLRIIILPLMPRRCCYWKQDTLPL